MARIRRIDIVTVPAFDSLLAEAQWRVLKRGMSINSRTQLIELGVAVLAALEKHMENCGYVPFLPQEVIKEIDRNWAYIRGSELGYHASALGDDGNGAGYLRPDSNTKLGVSCGD